MVKFYAQVVSGYRVTIDEGIRKVLGIEVGDWLEVEIRPVDIPKKKEEAEGNV